MFVGREEDLAQLAALWRNDFSKTFNVVFGEQAVATQNILRLLSERPLTLTEICDGLAVTRNGGISDHLEDLQTPLPLLGLRNVLLKSAGPYRQTAAARRKDCQVDLLGRSVEE